MKHTEGQACGWKDTFSVKQEGWSWWLVQIQEDGWFGHETMREAPSDSFCFSEWSMRQVHLLGEQEDNSGGLGKMYEMVILERREWPMCSGYMEMWTPELKEAETHQPAWMAFSTNIQRLGRRQEKADGQPRMALLGHVGGRPRKWWGN